MNILHAIFLGLVQGLAEFLPISSSGHLVLFSNLFGLESAEESNLLFDVLLHLGTLVAVCIVYRKDIADMIREFFSFVMRKKGRDDGSSNSLSFANTPPALRLIFLLIVSMLPLFLVFPFKGMLESIRTKPALVGVALLVTGVILFASDRVAKGRKTERSTTWLDALFVGVCQAVAIIPGISRSGATIAGGLFSGFDRKFAVRFSFLMSIPTVVAAVVLTLADALKTGVDLTMVPIYLCGMVVAGVSGFFAIKILSYLTEKGRFGNFAWYCWAVGLVTIITSLVV